MDLADLALCKHLLENSRTPVRELGERLGLSVAAVHGRIQSLRDTGVIKAFTARISLTRLGATLALIWGTSEAASTDDVLEQLRRDEHVYWVAFAGAGSMYIGTYLRSPMELDACVASVTKAAEMRDPVVGLLPMGTGVPEKPVLERADCRILRALHRDARRSVADVAEELGLSAKTVGRRLGRMVQEGSAEFSMEWYPDVGNDVICMWHLDVRPSANREKAYTLLVNRYGANTLFWMLFSNLPRFLLWSTWTGSMKELKELQPRVRREEPFARVVPNVIYSGYMFDTWRDSLLMKWAGPKESRD